MSVHEIRVSKNDDDPIGNEILAEAHRSLGLDGIEEVRTTKVYLVEGTTDDQTETLATDLFTDPIIETSTINLPPTTDETNILSVRYKPGVMDKAAASVVKAALDLGIVLAAAGTAREYTFNGNVTDDDIYQVASRLLVNDTVEEITHGRPSTLLFEGSVGPVETVPIRQNTSEELADLSKDKLFLNKEEMTVIQEYFRKLDRDPTDAELETIAASWSEHCGHKTFKAKLIIDGVEKEPLYTRIQNAAKANFGDLVISAFGDNSGVIKFYDGWAINGKVETHNSPSAIEPYGGAMTGSGGVFRDVMGTGQGAKTIISTDMFCFGPPDLAEELLPIGTLHPDYLQRRVVQGVRDYGNNSCIPTGNGSVHFHEDFTAKPTIIVGGYGILPEAMAQKGEPLVGDLVVVIGGKTGRDGIHGATFSSGEMTGRTSSVNSSSVQIGNPIEQIRMSDALIDARDKGFIRAITDCGAAGFASAIGEIGENIGVTIDISLAPLKYPGLAPWEIWLSESQERMVAAIPPENIEEFKRLCHQYNVGATVVGSFDGSNKLTVNYEDTNIVDLDYEFIKKGLPQRVMHGHWEKPNVVEKIPISPQSESEWIDRLKAVLAHGNVCSKEPIVRQYDHGVQGGSIVSPFGGVNQNGPNDAMVTRPLLDKPYGVVVSNGMNPILNRFNPYEGTAWAIAEAAANYVSAGGKLEDAAAVGNYIFPFPDEDTIGALDLATDSAVEMMNALGVPVISGKDSLSSTYRNGDQVIKIPPVYTWSIFGKIPDVKKTMTTDIKSTKSILYLVGKQDYTMGGSTYYDVTGGQSSNIPIIDRNTLVETLIDMQNAIESGSILSCHDVSEGGLVTAVTEMCIGGDCGATIGLHGILNKTDSASTETALFNETAGSFVIELPNDINPNEVFPNAQFSYLGYTKTDKNLDVVDAEYEPIFGVKVDDLKEAWQAPMKGIYHS